jgi:hypothetical protein
MAVSEVRLVVAPREARLVLVRDNEVVEEELWRFERAMGRSEAAQVVKAVFDSTYDYINYAVNGDD